MTVKFQGNDGVLVREAKSSDMFRQNAGKNIWIYRVYHIADDYIFISSALITWNPIQWRWILHSVHTHITPEKKNNYYVLRINIPSAGQEILGPCMELEGSLPCSKPRLIAIKINDYITKQQTAKKFQWHRYKNCIIFSSPNSCFVGRVA